MNYSETILARHVRTEGIRGDVPHCIRCSLVWPCDTVRLVEAWKARGHSDGIGGCFYANHICPESERLRADLDRLRKFCKGCRGTGTLIAEPALSCDCIANMADVLETFLSLDDVRERLEKMRRERGE